MDSRKNRISDEELDELFKSMSEGLSVDFEPEAWQKLDAMLQANKPMPPTVQFWKKTRIYLLLLLLLGVTYWSIHQLNQQKITTEVRIQKQFTQEKSIKRKLAAPITQFLVDRRLPDSTRGEDVANGKGLVQRKNATGQELKTSNVIHNRQELNRLSQKHGENSVLKKGEDIAVNQETAFYYRPINKGGVVPDTLSLSAGKESILVAKFLDTSLTIALPKVNASSLYSAQKAENKLLAKSPFTKRGLIVGLYFSPDFTTIANNRIEKIGTNYAIQLEYRFLSRWSVQAGVIRSKKVYDAYGDQYEIPLKWNAGVMPQSVDAVCDMLDIPLNIRYDITEHPEKRVFVTTGLTSYVMLKEAYYYTYDVKKIGTHDSWIGTSGPFLISNLNFSIGYEARITNRLTWQAEPFVRVPIASVGWSKVNLFTLGSFVSIKYRFK